MFCSFLVMVMMSEVMVFGGIVTASKKMDAFFQILKSMSQNEQRNTDGQ